MYIYIYTAISIYVVGSKLQGYGTRPKGGMGRLELILGFRGCRREMDMEAENTISIANISFIQMARHRRSSLYGRGIVNFADNYSLRSHIPLRSCLVGLRLWSDNVNWNSCMFINICTYTIYMYIYMDIFDYFGFIVS